MWDLYTPLTHYRAPEKEALGHLCHNRKFQTCVPEVSQKCREHRGVKSCKSAQVSQKYPTAKVTKYQLSALGHFLVTFGTLFSLSLLTHS